MISRIIAFFKFNGLLGFVRLLVDLLFSLYYLRYGCLFRFPSTIRNRGYIKIGKNCRFGRYSTIELFCNNSRLNIGDGFRSNSFLHIGVVTNVTIGNNVLVASGVYIADHSHGEYSQFPSSDPHTAPVNRPLVNAPVVIGNNVWLGEKVAVLPGVRVGHGSVVGAGAVVTKDLPDYCMAVGVPAKIIKRYDFSSMTWISV